MNIIEYENYQEKKERGHSDFPYITYPCSIPLDFSKVPLHWHDEMELIYIKKGQNRDCGLPSIPRKFRRYPGYRSGTASFH